MSRGEASTMEAMPLGRLEAEITELAGQLAAGECRWLELIADYDRRAGHETWGCRTVAHWLSWHCGLDMRSAREKVRVAHALADLPLVAEEFAAGRLSYSKVRAITRVATPADEEELVMYAQHATAAQVERIVRTYRGMRSADDETEHADQLHDEQYLQVEDDDDGAGVLGGRVPPEIAAALLKALELARKRMPADQRGEGGPAGPPRSQGAINIDALAMIVETFLEHDEVIAITPEGNVISSVIEPRERVRTTIGERNRADGLTIDATTITPTWWNDPLNLGDIVAGLEWHDERGDQGAAA